MPTTTPEAPQRLLAPHLADAIRQGKVRSGMSYRELGAAVGRSHAFLVQIAGGTRIPGRLTAQRLISVLGLDPETAAELLRVAPPPWWERQRGGSHGLQVQNMETRGVSPLDRPYDTQPDTRRWHG